MGSILFFTISGWILFAVGLWNRRVARNTGKSWNSGVAYDREEEQTSFRVNDGLTGMLCVAGGLAGSLGLLALVFYLMGFGHG